MSDKQRLLVRRRPRCRGVAFLIVLMTSSVVVLIGLIGMTASRIERRTVVGQTDVVDARMLADSALDVALLAIKNDSNWRNTYTSGVFIAEKTLGRGTYKWKIVDEVDGILNNNATQPVRVVAEAKVGSAVQLSSIEIQIQPDPLPVLQRSVHAAGSLNLSPLQSITVNNLPLSAGGTMTLGAGSTVVGNTRAVSYSGSGVVTGSKLVVNPPPAMPDDSVFDFYKARATEINYFAIPGGVIENVILSANNNPYGASTNPDGIYYIRVPYRNFELRVRNCRIQGTLIVQIDEKDTFRVTGGIIWEPHRKDLPACIVKAISTDKAIISIDPSGSLNESLLAVNLNPPSLPLNGSSNSNMSDTHPPMMKGIFHFIRLPGDPELTEIKSPGSVEAIFIAKGSIDVSHKTFSPDTSYLTTPPEGYRSTSTGTTVIINNSMRRDLK